MDKDIKDKPPSIITFFTAVAEYLFELMKCVRFIYVRKTQVPKFIFYLSLCLYLTLNLFVSSFISKLLSEKMEIENREIIPHFAQVARMLENAVVADDLTTRRFALLQGALAFKEYSRENQINYLKVCLPDYVKLY